MHTLTTPIGPFWVGDSSPEDTRVGIGDVTVVDDRGPASTFSWSVDQEEALFAAARDVGVTLELLVPGGWRLFPAESLTRFLEALKARTATMPRTNRMTPPG